MSDERPARPQYGEYATPEQQARAMGQTYRPPVPTPQPSSTPPPPDPSARVTSGEQPAVPRQARASIGDRFTTMFLLGIGLFSFLESISGYLHFSIQFNAAVAQMGGGTYSDPARADHVGIGLLIAHVVLYVGTLLWALTNLAHGRRAFYVPIVGFVIFAIVYCVALAVLLYSDPSLLAHVKTQFG
jgi:hypothetical protein